MFVAFGITFSYSKHSSLSSSSSSSSINHHHRRRRRRRHHHHHYHHHQSLHRECCRGTTDDFATSFLHFPLFSTALWDLPNSRPVHSLMLSSHLFLCLPCLLPPFTVPCSHDVRNTVTEILQVGMQLPGCRGNNHCTLYVRQCTGIVLSLIHI